MCRLKFLLKIKKIFKKKPKAKVDEEVLVLAEDKTFENGHKVNYPKDEPEEEKKIKPKLSIEQMANEWIEVLKKTATHSVSVGKFEQNLNPLRKEYINELQTIYTDLIQFQRIETAYISLQKQITNSYGNRKKPLWCRTLN